jgi:basic membrane protein A
MLSVLTGNAKIASAAGAAKLAGRIDLSKFKDKDIGVCLVVNTNLGDKSICDLSFAGLKKIEADYGVRVKCIELGSDQTKQIPTFIDLAEDPDWDIIISGTPNMRESLMQVAEEFPEQLFILYDASVANVKDGIKAEDYPNVYSMESAQNEGSYVVGAAAAMLTTSGSPKTNADHIIGFVGGGQNTAIEDFLVGYIQGAKAADAKIKILISYIGSFSDSAKGKELAMAQIDQGADVVFAVAGGAGLGVLAGAAEKGVYSIGVDSDQYTILKDSAPATAAAIATSMQKKSDMTVYNCVSKALEGTLAFGTYDKVGLSDGVVGAADNENFRKIFTAEQIEKLKEIEAKVASGEVKVFSAIGADDASIQAVKDSVQ